ncbi:aldo/keto reductase [Endozoicomonas sp. (ex Bugula neritina AB1)]|nr:aldo/keto reductase [Endozoicomonas sp. (ex Bugula neritina AB1)]
MKKNPLSIFIPKVSPLIYGCMGLGGEWNHEPSTKEQVQQANQVLDAAMDAGINFFDHADIYTHGKAEQVFGQALSDRPELRDQIVIQSKCGIRFADKTAPGRYDFSKEWIIHSVEHSLERLRTEYLDILLLHRPDPLMEPEEVAAAFEQLQTSGKVRHFGVSNMNLHQMKFLQSHLDNPLIVNQLEISLSKLDWLNDGTEMNSTAHSSPHFTSGTLEYTRTHNIQLQAWGCLSQGLFTGRDLSGQPEAIQNTANLVSQYSEAMNTSREAIVLAWLMKHPAGIQPVIGTTNLQRIKACTEAKNIELTREQWYRLYVSARGVHLP